MIKDTPKILKHQCSPTFRPHLFRRIFAAETLFCQGCRFVVTFVRLQFSGKLTRYIFATGDLLYVIAGGGVLFPTGVLKAAPDQARHSRPLFRLMRLKKRLGLSIAYAAA